MQNNLHENKSRLFYKIGFFIILALPILVWPPYFFPVDWGKSVVFRSIIAIILFLCLWQFFNGKEKFEWENIKKSKIVWILGGLFFIYLLASIFSVDPLFSFWGSPYRGGGFINFAFFFVLVAMSFTLLKKEDWKKTWIFSIFIGVLVSLIGIIQYYGLFNNFFLAVPSRPPSTMGNPDILAVYLLLLSFLTLSFSIKEQQKKFKIFYVSSLIIFLFTILITGSRAAYLGLLVGTIYFFLAYTKKIKAIKITLVGLLILAACGIFYANTINQYPKFLENNKVFQSISSRLSIKNLLADPRLAAWQIGLNAVEAKPLLGYGIENFAIGFDKYYDPSIPHLNTDIGWYDRAHNILIQTASDAGIFALIIYLALFISLFWQLQKIQPTSENKLTTHSIQATLIGYFVANFFGFDSFSTYLIFFLLIGYSLHLTTHSNSQVEAMKQKTLRHHSIQLRASAQGKTFWKSALIFVLFCILVIFLWQYNFVPLQINAKINEASDLASQKQCDQALSLMDKNLQQHSFLDSYVRMEYVDFTKTCATFYPQNDLTYIKKDLGLLDEAVKIQPLYTRYWLYMGAYESTLAGQAQDATTKTNLAKQANDDFTKALQLAPEHQEIYIDLADLQIVSGGYKGANDSSQKCAALNNNLGGCYFYLGLSQIYLKDTTDANKNIQSASSKGYDTNSEDSLVKLANAYNTVPDYQNLLIIFQKLIAVNPNAVQYHSSLAFIYAKLGEYDKARQEANKVLQLSPASKQNVEEFLNSLP